MSQVSNDAVTDPFSVYPTPGAVLDDETLPTKSKLKVLSAMEMDLVALQNADAENMPGDKPAPARLSDVRAAIRTLDPESEAHGEAERLRHVDDGQHAAHLTEEEARQGERLFDTGRERNAFTVYIVAAIAAFAVVMVALIWLQA